jgi:hypothetical protein
VPLENAASETRAATETTTMSEQDIRRIVREELTSSMSMVYRSARLTSMFYDEDGIVIPMDQQAGLCQLAELEKRVIYAVSEPQTKET